MYGIIHNKSNPVADILKSYLDITMGRGFLANLQGFPDVDRPALEPEVFHRFRLSLRTDILTFIMVGCAHMEPYCPGMAFLSKDQKDLTDREKSFTQDMDELADTLNFKESLVQLTPMEIIDIYHYILDNSLDTNLIAERWAESCSRYNAGEADESMNDLLVNQEATYEEHQEMLVQQHATFIDLRLGHGAARPYEKCLRLYFKEVGDFHGTRLHEAHAGKCAMDDMHLIKKSMKATPEDYRQAEEEGLFDNEPSESRWPSRTSSVRREDDGRIKEKGFLGNEQIKGHSPSRASSVRSEHYQRAKEDIAIGDERYEHRSPSRAASMRSTRTSRASRTESVDTKPSRHSSSSTQKPRNSRLFSDLLRGADEVTNLTRSFSATTPRPRSKAEDKTKSKTSPKRRRRLSPDNRSTTGKDTRDPQASSREDSYNLPEYYLRNLSLKDGQPDLLRDGSRASSDAGATILSDDTWPRRGRRQLTPTSDDEERGRKQRRDCARR